MFTPLDFGLVGFSFACGLGVKIAKPDKKVISLMGDGGFGMTISELSTAVEYKINTITIVLNNKSWGAEKAYQKDFYGKRYLGADISSPPFDKVAELYAKGFKVKKVSEINQAVREALKINKPVVIDVDVDPKALYSFRRDSFQHREKNETISKVIIILFTLISLNFYANAKDVHGTKNLGLKRSDTTVKGFKRDPG